MSILHRVSTLEQAEALAMARVRAALVDHDDDFGPAGDVESDPATWGPETDRHVWEPTDPNLDADGNLDVAACEPYEPTASEREEAARIFAAMECESLLGVELGPTVEDAAWWAQQTREPEPYSPEERAAMGEAFRYLFRPYSDEEKASFRAAFDYMFPPAEQPRGSWGGHPSENTL